MATFSLAGCGAPPSPEQQSANPSAQEQPTAQTTREGASSAPDASEAPTAAAEDRMYDTTEFYNTIADYQSATGATIAQINQAPDLKAKEDASELPPVAERIGKDPMVIVPLKEVGKYGGRIRTGATSPVTGSAETFTCRTQPLLIVDASLQEVVPNICKAYSYSDDLKEITFTLREGLKWSDGEPFTADDFLFFYEDMLLDDELMPSKPGVFKTGDAPEDLAVFEKLGDYEVKIKFNKPNASFSASMSNANRMYMSVPYAPAHYLKQFLPKYNPDADKVAKDNGYANWVEYFLYIYPDEVQARADVNLPVLDPWMLTKVDQVGNKYFDRNPYYWKIDTAGNQLPYIDGQDRLVLETSAITMKLISGELDIGLQFTAPADYTLYKDNEAQGNYKTYMWQDGRGQVLANMKFNRTLQGDEEKRALFNDVRFMEALSQAIDRDEINNVVWLGLATPRAAAVLPNVSFYEDRFGDHMIQYDVDAANAKLDAIGLAWDAKHETRTMPSGKPLEIIFEYTEVEGDITTIIQLVKKYWDAVGVKTTIKKIDQSLQSERSKAGDLEISVWNLDNCSEITFFSGPTVFGPYAPQWDLYITSDGEQGEKPSDDYMKNRELAAAFQSSLMGSPEYLEYGKQLSELAMNTMWNIGIAGLTPKPAIINNRLHNTPERGLYDYGYRFWMVFHPEQWYIE